MTNSLLIGKVIYAKLTTDETLKGLIGDNLFPLVADNDTNFPFVVYKRTSVTSINQSKDGYGEDLVSYEVTVVTQKYEEGLVIANQIRLILEKQKIESPIMTLYNNKLSQVSEEFSDNCFIQKLTFTTNIN